MAIQLLDTTITGIGSGGLPSSVITSTSLSSSGRMAFHSAARTTNHSLGGDSGWQDHLSTTFTAGVASRAIFWFGGGCTYESGAVQGFYRFVLNGSKIGYNWCGGRQSNNNGGSGSGGCYFADVAAGTHTILVQARNSVGGTTWQINYWSVDGYTSSLLGVFYYA